VTIRQRTIRFAAASALAAGAFVPLLATSAAAQGECPTASPSDVNCQPDAPVQPVAQVAGAQVAAVQASTPVTGGLPVTGGDVVGLAVIGASAIGAGGLLFVSSRRRQQQ